MRVPSSPAPVGDVIPGVPGEGIINQLILLLHWLYQSKRILRISVPINVTTWLALLLGLRARRCECGEIGREEVLTSKRI